MMASSSQISNDTRGWILCIASAIACVFGACIVCVDVFVRLIPGKRNFRIQESNSFLSGSMSLSFGVMIFSALFSMLPSSKRYLVADGWAEQGAGFLMMGAFVAGFIGIQVISRIIHRFMPSHVVDCDHSHGGMGVDDLEHHHHHHHQQHHHHYHEDAHTAPHGHAVTETPTFSRKLSSRPPSSHRAASTETTPLLSNAGHAVTVPSGARGDLHVDPSAHELDGQSTDAVVARRLRRPSMMEVRDRLLSFVKDTKANCDEFGPCYGYSDPCGQECRRHMSMRSTAAPAFVRSHPPHAWPPTATSAAATSAPSTTPTTPTAAHPATLQTHLPSSAAASTAEREDAENAGDVAPEDGSGPVVENGLMRTSSFSRHGHNLQYDSEAYCFHPGGVAAVDDDDDDLDVSASVEPSPPHHHHVPSNAFMSIGLQTVLAIGLHKFPEGFITFATNHVSPELGFSVFMALFVHNIAEGFAMALPLYMALGSRLKAVLWASSLGGLSQPLGAAMASMWLKYLGRHGDDNNGGGEGTASGTAYGVLFAVTAGIMVAVALQLFVEGLSLHHNIN